MKSKRRGSRHQRCRRRQSLDTFPSDASLLSPERSAAGGRSRQNDRVLRFSFFLLLTPVRDLIKEMG